MNTGKVIVLEGACDGIGKSTQYAMLKERLLGDGIKTVSHHFPSYHTYHGVFVEKYLSGEYGGIKDLSPYLINDFYAIDRAITWHTYLKKFYLEKSLILLDRYTTSSIIYQSSVIEDVKEKLDFIRYIIDFEYHKLGIQEPDCTIFLTAPFDLISKIRMERIDNDGILNDIHESDLSFMKHVYDNATFIADYLNWEHIECSSRNQMKSIEDIHEDIYTRVRKKLD